MDALLWWPFNGMVGLGLDSQQTPLSIKVLFTNFYLFNSHSHHHRSPSIDRLIAWSLVWPKYYNLPPPPPLQWLAIQQKPSRAKIYWFLFNLNAPQSLATWLLTLLWWQAAAFILYSDGNTRFTVKVDITYSRPVSPQSINCCNCGSRVHHHHQPIIIMATLVFRSVTGGGPQARPTIRFFSVQVQSTSAQSRTDPVICDYHSHPSFSSVTIPLWQSFFRGQSPPVGVAGHLLISIMLCGWFSALNWTIFWSTPK